VQSTSAKKLTEFKDKSTKPKRARRGGNKTEEDNGDDAEIKTKKPIAGSKRKRTAASETTAAVPAKPSKPKSGIASMIDHQDYQQTKRYNDYIKWKSALIQQLST
jgi:hypothetical protein